MSGAWGSYQATRKHLEMYKVVWRQFRIAGTIQIFSLRQELMRSQACRSHAHLTTTAQHDPVELDIIVRLDPASGRKIPAILLGVSDPGVFYPRFAPAPCHIAGIFWPLPGSRHATLKHVFVGAVQDQALSEHCRQIGTPPSGHAESQDPATPARTAHSTVRAPQTRILIPLNLWY